MKVDIYRDFPIASGGTVLLPLSTNVLIPQIRLFEIVTTLRSLKTPLRFLSRRFLKSRESVAELCACRLKTCSCDDGLHVLNAFSEKAEGASPNFTPQIPAFWIGGRVALAFYRATDHLKHTHSEDCPFLKIVSGPLKFNSIHPFSLNTFEKWQTHRTLA